MFIEPLNKGHLPEVLQLLELSLGFKATMAWYSWKHEKNPFGPSAAFVAMHNSKVMGVRFFMRWHFERNGQIFRAIRPVDTATHPAARGKGVFKSLTLEGINLLKNDFDFVFNTPNSNSYPGYLKMGWQKLKSCRLVYYMTLPVNKIEIERVQYPENVCSNNSEVLHTQLTPAYLSWRYTRNNIYYFRLKQYHDQGIAIDIIYKFKLPVIRVLDFWGDSRNYSQIISSLCHYLKTPFVLDLFEPEIHSDISIKKIRNAGDVVFKGNDDFYHATWRFSLGDIEGKI
jgi:hypothetical protein